jgi:hypothetical protein
MQKLHTHTQSPHQDIRGFCSEMRKLFQEADPAMSSTMKLELLLSKVNPSYRLDLLKQKPKDAEEFEILAKNIENTYLVYDAIAQADQSSSTTTSATNNSAMSSYSNFVQKKMFESEHKSNNYHDTTSLADEPYHSSAKSKYMWLIHTRTSYGQHYSPSNRRYNRESNDFHRNPRQHFYLSQTSLPQSQKVIVTTHSILPLMPSKANDNYFQP